MSDRYTVERIMEIIAYVMGVRRSGTPLMKVDTTELTKQGYTQSEISAAFSWIMERGEQNIVPHDVQSSEHSGSGEGSFRILHGIEAETITPEAWGLLLSYRDLGFLTNEDLEQIIERAMVMGGETDVDIAEIRALVAVYVMHQGPFADTGSRNLLLGSDAVN
jgi:uncharacterized protein Smg (DUF494 family)